MIIAKMNKTSLLIMALIIVSIIYTPYVMIDYSSLPGENGKHKITDINYSNEICPGDGKITGIEYIVFYLVMPAFSCLILIELVRSNDEKEN